MYLCTRHRDLINWPKSSTRRNNSAICYSTSPLTLSFETHDIYHSAGLPHVVYVYLCLKRKVKELAETSVNSSS